MENAWAAIGMTALAGLAMGIGGLLTFLTKKSNTKLLAISLGFSAGVMIYVSMMEIFGEANETLAGVLGEKAGNGATIAAFFGGVIFIALTDKLIHGKNNPHDFKLPDHKASEREHALVNRHGGMYGVVAIALHNFLEGITAFVVALQDPFIAVPVLASVAIHNIPVGIAVALPVYYSTGSKGKAFLYTVLTGLASPLGAVAAYFVLMPFLSDLVFGVLFAMVAGIMVFISFDELLPAAREYGEHHLSIYGLFAGMAVMAVSLFIFAV